jgi:hypothetical protein
MVTKQMSRGKRPIMPIAAVLCGLILATSLISGQALPAQAANPPWTKYSGEVTLRHDD